MDNLGAHYALGVRELIEARGASILFQPPCSSELNPIEHAWSKIKGILRGIQARTVESLRKAVHRARRQISPKDLAGWFKHCGVRQVHPN